MTIEPQPHVACAISRDLGRFDLLSREMRHAAGNRWASLGLEEAQAFLAGSAAARLDFAAVAIDRRDEDDLAPVLAAVAAARRRGVRVILVAEDASPAALHRLLREGADEFIPYPLPEGELLRAATRPRPAAPEAERAGVVLPVQSLAGGAGGTTLAVNLAWELALLDPSPRVCLLDLGLQFGAVATFLDLPRRETVQDLLTETGGLDAETLRTALQTYGGRLEVLTAPFDLAPLDLIGPREVDRLLRAARAGFDYVVVDLPGALTDWSATVLAAAPFGLGVLRLDMRSAQNVLRLRRALASADLPFERFRWALNRAPGFADLAGRSRLRRMADSLGLSFEILLPDGGRPAQEAADQGLPLAEAAPRNALRREIARLARSIHETGRAEAPPLRAPVRAPVRA
ncbi:AAA family ATPase [Rubellimicrobium aerolatum]|uniref:CpaE family protein n=1 Tax=Rubellimicrobium aerolatum TaxID=490979 RepID=A0ABW0SFL2_9RHOB|nr:pilus assembly protein CpaE [Rubellimicrobium aerolatum]MBP1807138.1 pilus assembly protein CpaE [Rubellimicrobium aerolatum]